MTEFSHWDFRFIGLARHISRWSKDPSTKCGAVIVRPDKTIASTGFNGFPRGTNDDGSLYADRELKYERVVHAECNAILHAREPLHGYTIYTYPPGISPSCSNCTKHIIQSGITDVVHVYDDSSEFSERWAESAKIANQLYKEAQVKVIPIPRNYWDDHVHGIGI